MNKLEPQIKNRFFAEIAQLSDGRIKLRKAKKLVGVNQHKKTWKTLDSRDLARKINKSQIVIK